MKILFVCLGNICRSPLAEGVFRHRVEAAGLTDQFHIESAGTGGWHVGNPPDRRMIQTAQRHGVDISKQRAQKFSADFAEQFDLILGMDQSNVDDMLAVWGYEDELDPSDLAKIRRFRDFDPIPENGDVPDPYYGGSAGFEHVFQMVDRTCEAMLHQVQDPAFGL
jgi:protein-tyrosine phosphatase